MFSLRRKQEVIVRVSGSHAVKHAPEYCHLVLGIKHDGPDIATTHSSLQEKTAVVTDYLRTYTTPVPDSMNNGILRCEVDIRASWNPAGHTSTVVEPGRSPVVMMMQQQEPKIVVFEEGYRGSMTLLATFRDFPCMGQVVAHLTSNSDIYVSRLDWVISTPLRRTLETRAANGAMRDAHSKAIDLLSPYSKNLTLRPIRIAADSATSTSVTKEYEGETHKIPEGKRCSVYVDNRASRVLVPAGEVGMWLAPQAVVIRAAVKVEFVA